MPKTTATRVGSWWRRPVTLEPDETLIEETPATKGSWGRLYLTDRRLIWSREWFGYGPKTLSIPFSEIESVTLESGFLGKGIIIKARKWKYFSFTTGSFWFLIGDQALPFLWHRLFAKSDTTERWFTLIEKPSKAAAREHRWRAITGREAVDMTRAQQPVRAEPVEAWREDLASPAFLLPPSAFRP